MFGPVVYCAESIDNENINLCRLYIDSALKTEILPSNGSVTGKLLVDGYVQKESDTLYSTCPPSFEPKKIALIPYHFFANRGESDMAVWLNIR